MKIKILCIVLILCYIQSCTPQKVNRLEYQTMLGFSLTPKQAKNLKYYYFELGYHDDELLQKIMKNNKIKNQYVEYFNVSSAKEDSIKSVIDKIAATKFENGMRTMPGIYQTTFTEKKDYNTYQIQNKETYGQSIITNDLYVLSANKTIAFKTNNVLNMNDELNKNTYSFDSSTNYEKYYYNEFGKLILNCNFSYREGECYVCKVDIDGAINKIETFKLSDFKKMKDKYFPFDNISYLENENLNPKDNYLKALNTSIPKVSEYKTEIGTNTSKESLHLLDKYTKLSYRNTDLKKEETFQNGKLSSVQYYLDKNELIENAKQKVKNTNNYVLVISDTIKEKKTQIFYHYNNDELIKKEKIKKDKDNHIIARTSYKGANFEDIDYSKTIKIYNDSSKGISLVFYYNKNTLFRDVLYKLNNRYSSINQIGIYSWWKLKSDFFPNNDLKFYRTAKF